MAADEDFWGEDPAATALRIAQQHNIPRPDIPIPRDLEEGAREIGYRTQHLPEQLASDYQAAREAYHAAPSWHQGIVEAAKTLPHSHLFGMIGPAAEALTHSRALPMAYGVPEIAGRYIENGVRAGEVATHPSYLNMAQGLAGYLPGSGSQEHMKNRFREARADGGGFGFTPTLQPQQSAFQSSPSAVSSPSPAAQPWGQISKNPASFTNYMGFNGFTGKPFDNPFGQSAQQTPAAQPSPGAPFQAPTSFQVPDHLPTIDDLKAQWDAMGKQYGIPQSPQQAPQPSPAQPQPFHVDFDQMRQRIQNAGGQWAGQQPMGLGRVQQMPQATTSFAPSQLGSMLPTRQAWNMPQPTSFPQPSTWLQQAHAFQRPQGMPRQRGGRVERAYRDDGGAIDDNTGVPYFAQDPQTEIENVARVAQTAAPHQQDGSGVASFLRQAVLHPIETGQKLGYIPSAGESATEPQTPVWQGAAKAFGNSPMAQRVAAAAEGFDPAVGWHQGEQHINDALRLAHEGNYGQSLATGATAVPELGMFIGPSAYRGTAREAAHRAAMTEAMDMKATGADRDAIRGATDWHQGADTNWRTEIPDDQMKVNLDNLSMNERPITDIVDHPELFDAYPHLRQIRMKEVDPNRSTNLGGYDPISKTLQLRRDLSGNARPITHNEIVAHELQHAIQFHENWAKGSNPMWAREHYLKDQLRPLDERYRAARNRAEELKAQGKGLGHPEYDAARDEERRATDERIKLLGTVDPRDLYDRSAGEVESRNTELRQVFDAATRKAIAPWQTEEFPPHRQIVHFDSPADTKALARPGAMGKLEFADSSFTPRQGLPATMNLPGIGKVQTRGIPELEQSAREYMSSRGMGDKWDAPFRPLNPEFSKRVAGAYEAMPHDPSNPRVRQSYEALADETLQQLHAAKHLGIDYNFIGHSGDPYAASPALGYADLMRNRRLSVFPTDEGFGSLNAAGHDNPLLKRIGPLGNHPNATVNDAFRIVHDLYGHYGPGNAFFRGPGEERAYQLHSRMFSPEAQPALATETRGQNSWVNYGPHAEHNSKASGAGTVYADQKSGLMPDWARALPPEEGADVDAYIRSLHRADGGRVERDDGGYIGNALNIAGQLLKRGASEYGIDTDKLPSAKEAATSMLPPDPYEGAGRAVNRFARSDYPGAFSEMAGSMPTTGALWERKLNPSGLYSHGAEAAANLPQAKGSPQQMFAMLGKAGVKPEEMKWSGVENAFAGRPSVTRDELANHFHENLPQLQETKLGGIDPDVEGKRAAWYDAIGRANELRSQLGRAGENPELERQMNEAYAHANRVREPYEAAKESYISPEYGEYTLPGHENYRELLLHLPEGDPPSYRGSHWDVPNVVAHLRMADRTGEINHAQMKDLGDRMAQALGAPSRLDLGSGAPGMLVKKGVITPEEAATFSRWRSFRNPESKLPGLEDRALHLEELQSDWAQQGRQNGFGPDIPQGPYVGNTKHWTELGLKRALYEAAKGGYSHLYITPGEAQMERFPEEGLQTFYDQIIPKHLEQLTKRLDPSVKMGKSLPIESGDGSYRMHSLPITGTMRENILKGLPAYKDGGRVHRDDGGELPPIDIPAAHHDYPPFNVLPLREDESGVHFDPHAGVAGSVERALRIAHQAAPSALGGEGRFDPHDPHDFQSAMDLAGLAHLGGAGAGAPEGALLAGARRKAKQPEVSPLRASTRFPTAVKRTEDPITQQLSIGLPEMRNDPTFEHNVGLLSDYPGFAKLKGMPADEAAERYIDQARGNLGFLYEHSPQVMKERSPHWYEGANRVSDAFAQRYGIPRQSASAAIAALSPQMDWFRNASLAERAGDILFDPSIGKKTMTPEMHAYQEGSTSLRTPVNQALFDSIKGSRLTDLEDPTQKALWLRLYDEAHNPRHYRTVTPEGGLSDFVKTDAGVPAKIGWGGLDSLAKAIQAYESGGDMKTLSPLLGTMHKVRSFYNNIELPNEPHFGDVTADTHQVAAAQMRPLSGNTPAVSHNLATGLGKKDQPPGYVGARSSAISGVQGTYGFNADATRRAAADYGLLPRAMQSATWEPIRELFDPAMKRNKAKTALIDDIWRAHDAGEIGLEAARRAILEAAGGIGTPSWAEPGIANYDPTRSSTYR